MSACKVTMHERIYKYSSRLFSKKSLRIRPARAVISFTFDDFHKSAATVGREILGQHNVRGTFYAACGLMGSKDKDGHYFDAPDLLNLHNDGHEIGNHTYSHRQCTDQTLDALEAESTRNESAIKNIIGEANIESFSYPLGMTSPSVKQLVGARFSTARGIDQGINSNVIDLALLKAVRLYQNLWTPEEINNWITEAVRKKGWLIFYTHAVTDTPNHYDATPELLDAALTSAKNANCDITTVGNALRHLTHTAN